MGSATGKDVGGTPPPPAKRRRRSAAGQGGEPGRCQVVGCKADLSEVKAYYSKHKVCGVHSKSPMVIVDGLQQRFCQQCSRFHQLPEFDQGKRSCRRRLACHNERRRKPPPLGSILSTQYGTLSSSMFGNNGKNGSFLMDFTSYPELLLLGSNATTTYPSPGVPCGESFTGATDPTRALSLLSNQPSGLGVNRLLNTDGTHYVHPSGSHDAFMNEFSSQWDFKGDQVTNGSDKIIPESHYSGELEIAPQTGKAFMGLEYSTGYDSSVQNVHWTL